MIFIILHYPSWRDGDPQSKGSTKAIYPGKARRSGRKTRHCGCVRRKTKFKDCGALCVPLCFNSAPRIHTRGSTLWTELFPSFWMQPWELNQCYPTRIYVANVRGRQQPPFTHIMHVLSRAPQAHRSVVHKCPTVSTNGINCKVGDSVSPTWFLYPLSPSSFFSAIGDRSTNTISKLASCV